MENSTLSTPWTKLFLNEHLSDVELKIVNDGYTYRFPAHSLMLRLGSQEIADRLELDPAGPEDRKVLTFVDFSPHTFLTLLRYLYTHEITSIDENCEELFNLMILGSKMKVKALVDKCQHKMMSSVRLKDVIRLLQLSERVLVTGSCEERDLVKPLIGSYQQLLLNYGQIVFSSGLIEQVEKKILTRLVASQQLNVVEERTVVQGIWRWGRRSCSKLGLPLTNTSILQHLGELLDHVRWSRIRHFESLPQEIRKIAKKCDCKREPCPRRCYSPPDDLLWQSQILLVTAPWEIGAPEPFLDKQTVCLQISCQDEIIFLTAVTLEAERSLNKESMLFIEPLSLAVRIENSGLDFFRQRVSWEEVEQRPHSSERYFAKIRFHKPLVLRRMNIYTFYLFRHPMTEGQSSIEEEEEEGKESYPCWKLPRRPRSSILSRIENDRNIGHLTVHSDVIRGISSLYLLDGLSSPWSIFI